MNPSATVMLVLLWVSLTLCAFVGSALAQGAPLPQGLAVDPFSASYRIGDYSAHLRNGEANAAVAPGSAARFKTSVFGSPIRGDVDGDGDEDAALWLVHSSGGSGTFIHLAVALNERGRYRGSPALLLGDRILPLTLQISNGLIIATYLDRGPGRPMGSTPTEERTVYLVWKDGELAAVPGPGDGERIFQGWLVLGHEVRSFRPCGTQQDLWLSGDSPALDDLNTAYTAESSAAVPYKPLFVSITGRSVSPPREGFGADYAGALFAGRLLRVWPKGACGLSPPRDNGRTR